MPLDNSPATFQISMGGTTYQFTFKWNDSIDAGWVFDIADENNNPIICNNPLITGANLFDGLDYLNFNGSMVVVTDGSNPFNVPTFDNLGTNCNVYYQTSVT